MAGTVAETGPAVEGFQAGDRVCALLAGGGYAEQVAVHHKLLTRIPDTWSFAEAAAVPEVFYTAFVNLFLEGALSRGETVLIHAGASGVGTAAIQLAREAGCRILATAGSEPKLACCRRLGAEFAVNYRESDFAAAVLDHCDGTDVVLDVAGGSHLVSNLELLKLKGRLVIISLLGGAETAIDLGVVLSCGCASSARSCAVGRWRRKSISWANSVGVFGPNWRAASSPLIYAVLRSPKRRRPSACSATMRTLARWCWKPDEARGRYREIEVCRHPDDDPTTGCCWSVFSVSCGNPGDTPCETYMLA